MSIEKSPLVREQEAKIATLQERIKKKNTVIKSLKTRLSNMQSRVEDISRSFQRSYASTQESFFAKLKELKSLIEKLAKDKRFDKEDRKQLNDILADFEGHMPDEDDTPPPFEEPEFADEKARNFNLFAEFKVEPETDDQQSLRKLYLQLSKRFHPDRAKNEREKQLYHEIQQRVINAYQAHDLQALVTLAMEHDLSLLDTADSQTDVLEQRIQFLTHQLEGLEQQQQRLSAEIKNLRQSELGAMLTEVDGYAREGLDITDAASTMGPAIQQIDTLISLLKEVDRTGNIDLLLEMHASPFGDHYDPFGEDDVFYGDEEDDGDFLSDLYAYFLEEDNDDVFNTDARFPPGSWVQTSWNIGAGKSIKVNGQVLSAYFDHAQRPVYDIQLDIDALRQLPETYLRKMFKKGHLGILASVSEGRLKLGRAVSDEQQAAMAELIRRTWRKFAFKDLPAAQRKRILAVVEADPEKTDTENWLDYFNRNFTFPYRAEAELESIEFDEPEFESSEVKITRHYESTFDYGLTAEGVDKTRNRGVCPLDEVRPRNKNYEQMLDDYREWIDVYDEYEGENLGF